MRREGDASGVGGRGNPSVGLRAIEKLAADCSQHVGDLLGALDGAGGVRSEATAQQCGGVLRFGCEGQNAKAVCSGTPIVSRSRLSDRAAAIRPSRRLATDVQPSSSARNAAALRAVTTSGQVAIRNRSSSPRIAHVDAEAENRRSRVRIL
jgi:hypothetical protein